MEQVKRVAKKIFFLPPLPTVLIALPSFALCFVLLAVDFHGILAYLSYGLSAYAMVICITGAVDIKQALQNRIEHHPLRKKIGKLPMGERFVTDAAFRTEVSLYLGFGINLLNIVMNIISGICYQSTWFGSLAAYYTLLAVMRLLLLRYVSRNEAGKNIPTELRRYRLCGITLLFMTHVLGGIVLFMVYQNRRHEYPGLLIYAIAMYAFYSVTLAVINLVRFRKHGSPVLSAAKVINLVVALVSMLSLTTAMLSQFGGEEDPRFHRAMTGATGGGVCILVLAMAIYMIAHATKQLKSKQWKP